jgi:diguanylate cyclase (GGDEF)-like protein
MAIVPLAVSGDQLGFIALADRSNVVLATEEAELLELLGVQAAAQLRGLAAVDQLRDRAARDPLTGLGHHATFHARLPQRRKAAEEEGRRLAVVLADVDGFKTVNDRRGLTVGDDILRGVAALLEEVAPAGAAAYRIGPDEFALVVAAEDRGEVQQVAWQLQAQARSRLQGTTLSIGVAVAQEGESEAELVERADAAVLEVKRRGRDGVAVAPPRLTEVKRPESWPGQGPEPGVA